MTPIGFIKSRDTGGGGSGWNNFVEALVGTINLPPGKYLLRLKVSSGDDYGIEIDYVKLHPLSNPPNPPEES